MYQHLILSIMLAAPVAAQTPATQKPAAPTTKPATAEAGGSRAAAKGVRTVEIIGTEDMKYSVTNIAAKPGEQLRVRLVVKGAMPKIAMAHNFVLLNKAANVTDFVTAAMNARTTDFIPAEKKADVSRTPVWPAQEKPSKSPSRSRPPPATIRSSARSRATSRPG